MGFDFGINGFFDTGILNIKSIRLDYKKVTSNITLTRENHYVDVDATNNTVTIYLPSVNTLQPGDIFSIKKIDTSSNQVTIIPFTGQTIDGESIAPIVVSGVAIEIVCTGSSWSLH